MEAFMDTQGGPSNEFVFKPGDILFRENDQGPFFYIIQKGQVEVLKLRGKTKVPLAILQPGQCVGEFAALDGKRRSATAIALTEVVAVRIGSDTLDAQIRRNPAWFRTITFSLVERLRQTNEILRRNCIVDEQLMTMISNIQRLLPTDDPEADLPPEQSLDEALSDLRIAMGENPLKGGAGEALKPKAGAPGGRKVRA